jgi:hypothetical protein
MSVILIGAWAYVLTLFSRWIHSIHQVLYREDAMVILFLAGCIASVVHTLYPWVDRQTSVALVFSLGLTLGTRVLIPQHPTTLWILIFVILLLLRHIMLLVVSPTFVWTCLAGLFFFAFFLPEGVLILIGVVLSRFVH